VKTHLKYWSLMYTFGKCQVLTYLCINVLELFLANGFGAAVEVLCSLGL
jgi:hypothetical protein